MVNLRPAIFFAAVLLSSGAARADEGSARFDAAGCRSCHRVGPRGGDAGPDLTLVGVRRPRAWIEAWLKSPRGWKADTRMPEQGLSAADRSALAEFLSAQKGQAWGEDRPWRGAEPGEISGKEVYVRAGCIACHGTQGRGGHPNPGAHGDVIPALSPLMGTYKKEELKAKIKNGVVADAQGAIPAAVNMPAWKDVLNDDELDALTGYLLSLAEGQPKTDW
jgi:mono/diheme cytochrome c family protein